MLFLDATVEHLGLRVDLEYHAANHRELRDNGSGRFGPEPDRLHNILIPASSDNGSENGLRKGRRRHAERFCRLRKRSTACRDSAATSLDQSRGEYKCVSEENHRETFKYSDSF